MRLSTAWARTAAQNVTLKVATVTLAVISVLEMITIIDLASRAPIIIERACFSKILQARPIEPTQDEMKAFLIESLPMRFDSNGYLKEGFLSLEEVAARDKEQLTLKQRQMGQQIILSDINISGKEIRVTADRLVSIGKIKSALPLTLKIDLKQTNRTESNPYGLILGSVTQIEEKEGK